MIRYERFSKSFDRIRAVDSFSLTVERGEVVALLGPNGSGKTTTLKAAAGLLKPTSGAVSIGGRPASEPAARHVISFLPQKVSFPDSLTGREVVEFYRRLRNLEAARTDDALRFASLNGASNRALSTYSGGMLQRLGLAVAVLPDAEVMLLDEPTAALDPAGLSLFYDLAERRRGEGKAVLFTSHQLGDVERLADRFAIIVDGKLVALMTAPELSGELASRGAMRLTLDREAGLLLPKVLVLSPHASAVGNEIVIPGSAQMRAQVIDIVRESNATIQSLTTEEGRLDMMYRELVARCE
ncbi:MAG: ABC transporter ATP-binding protein [Acidobacteriota bacterium]